MPWAAAGLALVVALALAPARSAAAADVAVLKSSDAPAWRPAIDALRRVAGRRTPSPSTTCAATGPRPTRVLATLKGRAAVLVAMGPLAAQAARETAARRCRSSSAWCQDPAKLGLRRRPTRSGVAFDDPRQEPARGLPHGEPARRAHRASLYTDAERRPARGGGAEGGAVGAPGAGGAAGGLRAGRARGAARPAHGRRGGGRPLDPARSRAAGRRDAAATSWPRRSRPASRSTASRPRWWRRARWSATGPTSARSASWPASW